MESSTQPEVSHIFDFLNNLIVEPEVERYFKEFGKVVDVAIMRDKHTGRSRGFAFVTFEVYGDDAVASLK